MLLKTKTCDIYSLSITNINREEKEIYTSILTNHPCQFWEDTKTLGIKQTDNLKEDEFNRIILVLDFVNIVLKPGYKVVLYNELGKFGDFIITKSPEVFNIPGSPINNIQIILKRIGI